MHKELKVKNLFGEELDVLIEGNGSANEVIVFVHGFGTDKGEGVHLFAEMADSLKDDYLLVRFDQSGYGKSGGKQEDTSPLKAAKDLDVILNYVRYKFPKKNINIFAHSLGTLITSLLSPSSINKTVFTGAINVDLSKVASGISKRIESRGGVIDENGVSIYPRSSGAVQNIGKEFWQVLKSNNMYSLLKAYAQKTNLLVFKSIQDQIVGHDASFDAYKNIDGLKYIEIDGDHNFADKDNRQNLFTQIKEFLIVR